MKFLQMRQALEMALLKAKPVVVKPPDPGPPKHPTYYPKPSPKEALFRDGTTRVPINLQARLIIQKAPWWAHLNYAKSKDSGENSEMPDAGTQNASNHKRRKKVLSHNGNGAAKARCQVASKRETAQESTTPKPAIVLPTPRELLELLTAGAITADEYDSFLSQL